MNSFFFKSVVKNIFIFLVTSYQALIFFLSSYDKFSVMDFVLSNVILSLTVCNIEGIYSVMYSEANKLILASPPNPLFDFLSRVMKPGSVHAGSTHFLAELVSLLSHILWSDF